MRGTMVVGMCLVLAAGSVGLVSCASESAPSATTSVRVGPTNYVTIPPAPSTVAPQTTAADAPGSKLAFPSEYTIQEGDYPSTIATKFQVSFQELMQLNNWTLVGQDVPEWPGVGATIQIPAGATVPGTPPDPGLPPTTLAAGSPVAPTTAAPPQTTVPVTTTTAKPVPVCGTYTIVDGDYPGLVATKLETTIADLAAANADTDGYRSFYVGLVINDPC